MKSSLDVLSLSGSISFRLHIMTEPVCIIFTFNISKPLQSTALNWQLRAVDCSGLDIIDKLTGFSPSNSLISVFFLLYFRLKPHTETSIEAYSSHSSPPCFMLHLHQPHLTSINQAPSYAACTYLSESPFRVKIGKYCLFTPRVWTVETRVYIVDTRLVKKLIA